MLSPIGGRLRRVVPWTTAWAVPLAVLAITATPARAIGQADRPAGSYSVDVFSALSDEARLPQELRASSSERWPARDAGARGPVQLRWTAQEQTGFRGYRLTARIEDGPLSGVAAQWQIAPGSGRRQGSSGAYEYLVRLELPAFSRAYVRVALEGVLADGSRVLLALREARIKPRPQPLARATTGRRQADERLRPSVAAAERASLAVLHASTSVSAWRASACGPATVALGRAGCGDATRGRGPPCAPLPDTVAL
jgi:hypothetical protein